jgi:hypothetical protein
MHPLNGFATSPDPQPIRIVWFGESVVSDWNNPVATTTRAVMRALGQAGHDVVFHERRNNAPMLEAMKARGSAMYRAFQSVYPDIRYRTYDLPRTSPERTVWLARETAIAEALIVQDSAPDEVIDWLGRFAAPSIVTLYQRTMAMRRDNEPKADLVLSPVHGDDALFFGPAVLPETVPNQRERSDALTVVYSGTSERNSHAVAAGPGNAGLEFVPEVRLIERYGQTECVTVIDEDSSPFAIARAFLAVASGVEDVRRISTQGSGEQVDGYDHAGSQALDLVTAITDALSARRSGKLD